jgi:hypothetical protein
MSASWDLVNAVCVAQLVAEFDEPSRVKAYHEASDGRWALSIAMSWLRPRFSAPA